MAGVNRLPRLKLREEAASTRSHRPLVVKICCFFALIITAGLVMVYSVNMGADFLERHDAPSRPEEPGARRSLSRQPGFSSIGPAQEQHVYKEGLGSVTAKDLLVAVVTDQGHEAYVDYSRSWRMGIQTYVATNHSISSWQYKNDKKLHNEVWGYYPDDKPLHTLALKGDSRAALAPFLAYRDWGDSFKWLLYGDDDTFFFTDAVLRAVAGLDPDMPYFLTDHMWWTDKWIDDKGNPGEETHHPHKMAPLCVPCNSLQNTSHMAFPYPNGCPCRPPTICAADKKGIFFKGPQGQCGIPRVPIRTFSMHGGAGAVISIGLLKAIPFDRFEDCVTSTYSTGGDAVISICLWQVGYWMTNPDPGWHPEGLHMFDIGDIAQNDHEEIVSRVATPMGRLLEAAAGFCKEGLCKLEREHFVTLHMRSRKFPSKACFSQIVKGLSLLEQLASDRSILAQLIAKGAAADFIEVEVMAAVETYNQWQSCHTFSREGSVLEPVKDVPECFKMGKVQADKRARYVTALESATLDDAAFKLALEIISLTFGQFPSSTGTYGEIAIGRE